jgi:hypothetical protein
MSAELDLLPNADLFRGSDPAAVLASVTELARELKGTLAAGGMIKKIPSKRGVSEHVTIDGWQTCGALVGVSPYVVWSRPLDGDDTDSIGWEARAEARTVDGRVVGAAEAMVTRDEKNWVTSDDYAMRSMAQTRAMSKALRGPLGFVVALAGMSATPAEEMPADGPEEASETPLPSWAQPVPSVGAVAAQLVRILQAAGVAEPARHVDRIGNRLLETCDMTVPACVGNVLTDVADTITEQQKEEQ